MNYSRFLLAALLLLAVGAGHASGQSAATGANLHGILTDPSAASVSGGTVTVRNTETNQSRIVTTDGEGRYSVLAVPVGTYDITASAPGFQPVSMTSITLRLGETVSLNIALAAATASHAVTVTAVPPLVDMRRTAVAAAITREQIEQLPINGRNFMEFSALTGAAARDKTPQQGATTTSGLSFTGQRGRSNNVMVDGFDNNDTVVGAVRLALGQEAVREFQVVANSFSAEFGKASAGVVNIITRSGTNVWHGNAFFFFRDRRLNAKHYFEKFDVNGNPLDRAKSPFDQRQWGGTVGGPVRHDRLFVFAAREQSTTAASRFVTIEPAAVDALSAAGFPVAAGYVPLSNTGSSWFGRIDANLDAGQTLVARAVGSSADREGIDDFGGSIARSRGTVQLRSDWAASAAHTSVVTDRSLNELRFQYARNNQAVNSLDEQGGPTLELAGVASVGRQRLTPQLRRNHRVELLETLSYVRGRHQVKLGGEFSFVRSPGEDNQLPLHFGGRYIFAPIAPLGIRSSIEGLQRGIPAAYVQGYGTATSPTVDYADLSLFAQDEWSAGRWVIKPGLRYQRQFWQDYTSTVSDAGGSIFSYPLPRDGDNIAPRIAVAHSLTADGATSARAAYGMFFDNIITAVTSVGRLINGSQTGVRTLVLTAPRAGVAWNAPGRRLSEAEAATLVGGSYPSSVISADPSLETSYTHQLSAGVERALTSRLAVNLDTIYVRGFNLPGAIDYNPILPVALGPGRRPNDRPCSSNPAAPCVNGGIAGTSASILQYTSYGESWYRGVTLSLRGRLAAQSQLLVSYTLAKAEDTTTDFQSNFVPQSTGFGRNPADRAGLPLGFDPRAERGLATHDQRHRLVLSTTYGFGRGFHASAIVSAASGQPFSPLAGADLNGDGDAGGFPSDRARRDRADERSSVARNSERTGSQVTVDARVSRRFRLGPATAEAIVEAFNLFNRTNFVEDTQQSSFVVFGMGTFPTDPLPSYRRYTQALPPRQIQLAAKISF